MLVFVVYHKVYYFNSLSLFLHNYPGNKCSCYCSFFGNDDNFYNRQKKNIFIPDC